jgi:hypothetical protein
MTLPEGLIYVPGFLTEAGERDVLAVLATVELHPYVLHDTPSRLLVRSFGLALVTGAYDAGPAAPVPAGLEWLRDCCAALMGREPAAHSPALDATLSVRGITSVTCSIVSSAILSHFLYGSCLA